MVDIATVEPANETTHYNAAGERISQDQWLRSRCIGSSDAAAICGLSPWKTPYAAWAEKVGLTDPIEDNEHMRFGRRLEPVIADEFQHQTGMIIERCQILLKNPHNPFMTATPDYIVIDEDGEHGILEIKNANYFANRDWEDGLPDPVHCQVMHQLACCELKFGIACALLGGNKLKWHRVERDEEVIASLVEIEREFWERVQTNTPPAFSSDDSNALNAIYPKSNGDEVELPDAAQANIDEYFAARAAKDEAESRMELAAAELKGILSNAERGRCGKTVVTWKTTSRKGYTVQPTEYRQFRITKGK